MAELLELLGKKEIEIHLLQKQVKVLSETIERMTPKPRGETGDQPAE